MIRRALALLGVLALFLFSAPRVGPRASAPATATRYDVLLLLRVAPFVEGAGALSAADAEERARDIFRALRPRLREWQATGELEDFSWLNDAHAVRVRGASAAALEALAGLDGVLAVRPATAQAVSCARRAVASLAARQGGREAGLAAPEATNPTVYVDLRYGVIAGVTDPHAPITVTIRSARGTTKGIVHATSADDGSYSTWASLACVALVPGDTVEVRAGAARVASTTVVGITGEVNPVTDVVSGSTAASRSVEVRVYQEQGSCSPTLFTRAVTSGAAGAYSANFSGLVDIKRYARAQIWVYDGNRNATFFTVSAPHIAVSAFGSVEITMRPNRLITGTLRSGSTVLDAETTTTDGAGDGHFNFSPEPAPGNTIHITDGSMAIVYQVVPLTLTGVNLGANQFSLQTAANRLVKVSTRTLASRFCTVDADCRVLTSDGAGNVNVALGSDLDLGRGDQVEAVVYDSEGNWQENERHTGYVEVSRQRKSVSGFWEQTQANLQVLLRGSGGAVKASRSIVVNEDDGSFFTTFGGDVAVGDQFEVGNGVLTYTVPVVNLTVFVNETTDFVSGQAPANGPLVVQGSSTGCWQGNAAGTTYNARLKTAAGADVDLKAGDSASAYYTDANGHQNVASAHAPWINAAIGTGNVNGYIREAGTPLTVTLRSQGGSVKATQATTSSASDFYSVAFSDATIAVSDRIEVQPRGGAPFSLTVPHLTVLLDPPGNRVYGQALPNTAVSVSLYQAFSLLGIQNATSDQAGNYSASFAGQFTFDCQPVRMGECSEAEVSLRTPEGHRVSRRSAPPPDVSPDAYEQDDTPAAAKPYAGLQHHTFDTENFFAGDEDWVKFTVAAADVGKLYIVETLNNGPQGDTILTLYDTDGARALATAGDYGEPLAAQIRWRFGRAGTYYVQVRPGVLLSPGGSCGATYDLFISDRHLFLPLTLKDG